MVFVLKLSPHESFERSGNDLLTNVSITISEALLGFSRILITHLDGRGVKVTSPPGKIISPGESIVLRGEGMPTYKNPDQRGNLYVIIHIDMPDESWLRSIDRKVSNFDVLAFPLYLTLLQMTRRHLSHCYHPRKRRCHRSHLWLTRQSSKRVILWTCVRDLSRLARTSLIKGSNHSLVTAMMTGRTKMKRAGPTTITWVASRNAGNNDIDWTESIGCNGTGSVISSPLTYVYNIHPLNNPHTWPHGQTAMKLRIALSPLPNPKYGCTL